MDKITVLFVCISGLLLFFGTVCAGSSGEDIPVSKNVYGNYWTSIDGDRIVWLSQYYSYGENQVRESAKYRIIVYNITSGEESHIPVFGSRPGSPGISGHYVVWSDSVPGGSTGSDIYFHDLETGTTKAATTEYGDQIEPVIAGDIIIWKEYFGPGKEMSRISIYNIGSENLSHLEFRSPQGIVADTDGKNIIFSFCNGTSYSICLYNISEEEKTLVYEGTGSARVSISGDNAGWIEYVYRGRDPGFYKLMFCNISSSEIETLKEGYTPVGSLDIDDDLAVYLYGDYGATYDKNGTSLYYYDLKSKETGLLSERDGNQRNPSVSDGIIVWQDNYPENRGIYLRYYDGTRDEVDSPLDQSGNRSKTPEENVESPGFGSVITVLGLFILNIILWFRKKVGIIA